ncbi:MAG: tetratricopeptide repeat protein [Methylobacter sp.]|nr:tetratricopeptide repeat protein [Methylobacter sp.]
MSSISAENASPNPHLPHFEQGKQHRRQGNSAEAMICFREAIRHKADYIPAYNNLGNLLQADGETEQALTVYQEAIGLAPHVPVLHCNLASLRQTQGDFEAAIAGFRHALALKPDFYLAHFNLGKLLAQQEDYPQAIAHYRAALRVQPRSAEVYLEYGAALSKTNRHPQALKCFERAIDIEPGGIQAYLYAGAALIESKQYHLALLCCDRALAQNAQNEIALYNKALALSRLQRLQDAIAENEKAIALKPDYADAHWNASLCHLMLGDYAKGWPEYEWRWRRTGAKPENLRQFDQPLWLGNEPLQGKTILLHAEQGIGDTLQFCRYVEKVSALGGRVVLEVYPGLKPLLQHLPVAQLSERGESLPDFDYHCPLLSLPLAFNTNRDSDIASANPYLYSDPDKAAHWRQTLGEKTQARIGLVWSGNPGHQTDHERSIPLVKWATLLAAPVHFISLQKELRDKDAQTLLQRHGIRHYGEQLHDFSDTAALIAQLDLVIAVDTAVAHLAAAMGKPVWLLLHYNPDWRWQLQRSDSPWYPSVRLFRQTLRDDWQGVMASVAQALAGYLSGSDPIMPPAAPPIPSEND